MKTKLLCAAAVLWLAAFAAALIQYPGSKLIYSIFSVTFLAMLAGGFYKQDSYGYMFLTVFLWLGFWLKFTVHTITGAKYVEAIGAFTPSPGNLDNVLKIAILASLGMIAAGALSRFIPWGRSCFSKTRSSAPEWYPRFRKRLWLAMWVCIVLIPCVNTILGIHQIGLAPKVVLPWPLNFTIAWALNIGLAMGIVTLLWWDIDVKKSPLQAFLALLTEASVSSTSILSRGTFLWQVLPVAAVLFKNMKSLLPAFSKIKAAIVAGVAMVMFIISFTASNTMRWHYYYGGASSGLSSEFGVQWADFLKKASSMGVDRWIGMEGVMAVYAYPEKGRDVFWFALTEKRMIRKGDLYRSVCQAGALDNSVVQTGSLPGLAAFLYYSGSPAVVFLGVLLTSLLVILSEGAIGNLTANPFICSLWGIAVANNAAQLSGPRQMLPYFSMIICAILFIRLVQGAASRRPQPQES